MSPFASLQMGTLSIELRSMSDAFCFGKMHIAKAFTEN